MYKPHSKTYMKPYTITHKKHIYIHKVTKEAHYFTNSLLRILNLKPTFICY